MTTNINPETIEWENATEEAPSTSKRLGLSASGELVYGNSSIQTIIAAGGSTSSTATINNLIYLIDTNTNNTAYTLNLFSAVGNTGAEVIIKDSGGDASSYNITIDGNGSETIDGSTTIVINSNYGRLHLVSNGTSWFDIS